MKLTTPRGLALRAVALVLAFGIAHAAGFREHAAVLSGTPGDPVRGLVYVGLHFAAVIAAPALLVAASFLAAFERVGRREAPSAPTS